MDQELQHFFTSRTEGEKPWTSSVELNGNQVWNNGEDWLLCMIHWQLEGVWTTAGKSCLHRMLRKVVDDGKS